MTRSAHVKGTIIGRECGLCIACWLLGQFKFKFNLFCQQALAAVPALAKEHEVAK